MRANFSLCDMQSLGKNREVISKNCVKVHQSARQSCDSYSGANLWLRLDGNQYQVFSIVTRHHCLIAGTRLSVDRLNRKPCSSQQAFYLSQRVMALMMGVFGCRMRNDRLTGGGANQAATRLQQRKKVRNQFRRDRHVLYRFK